MPNLDGFSHEKNVKLQISTHRILNERGFIIEIFPSRQLDFDYDPSELLVNI